MAIFTTENKEEIIVTCGCGFCEDSFRIKLDKDEDDIAVLTYLSGNWYSDQNNSVFSVIKNKLKRIWAIIANKDYYYSDVRMSEEDFQRFKEYINQF